MVKAKKISTPKVKKEKPINPAIEALNGLLVEMESYISGGGTVESRQEMVDKLHKIIEGL